MADLDQYSLAALIARQMPADGQEASGHGIKPAVLGYLWTALANDLETARLQMPRLAAAASAAPVTAERPVDGQPLIPAVPTQGTLQPA